MISGIQSGTRVFDRIYGTVVDDLKAFYGNEFDPRQLTCEVERTGPAEISMSISYKGEPALWQTLDLMADKWKCQYKRWSVIH